MPAAFGAAEAAPPGPAALRAAEVRRVLKRCVRKICRLLTLRKIWANLGQQLQTKPTPEARSRQTSKKVWAALGRYLQTKAVTFKHLERKKGVLIHRNRSE